MPSRPPPTDGSRSLSPGIGNGPAAAGLAALVAAPFVIAGLAGLHREPPRDGSFAPLDPELLAAERALNELGTYRWLDRRADRVGLPIERGMEVLADEVAARREPRPAPSVTAATAPDSNPDRHPGLPGAPSVPSP